jgi:hypothetical protein
VTVSLSLTVRCFESMQGPVPYPRRVTVCSFVLLCGQSVLEHGWSQWLSVGFLTLDFGCGGSIVGEHE